MLATTYEKFGQGKERSRKETEALSVRTIKFNMLGYKHVTESNLARTMMCPYSFYHDGG